MPKTLLAILTASVMAAVVAQDAGEKPVTQAYKDPPPPGVKRAFSGGQRGTTNPSRPGVGKRSRVSWGPPIFRR